ncbi:MAG: hypothetical protein IPJ65_43210 [Archangiaceae bacterium]|nr:hypothetical protein [Archangiaceae bacterium]
MARTFGQTQPLSGWFIFELAKLWFWSLFLCAACVSVGCVVVGRLISRAQRTLLETVALAFPVGLVIFVLGMYGLGFLHLLRPVFAVLWPTVMLLVGLPSAHAEWSSEYPTAGLSAPPLVGFSLVARVAGVLALGALYLGAMTPDAINYDATWVHMVIAQDYAREGRIVPFPGDWQLNVPHLASVVYAWGFLVPGLALPQLKWMMGLHLEVLVVVWTLVGVAAAARWLADRNVRATWTVFVLFPGVFVYDGNVGGSADHFAAVFMAPLLLLTGMVARCFERRASVLWGGLVGGALLAKVQSLYLVAPLGLILLGRAAWLFFVWRHDPRERRAITAHLGAAATAALVVLLPHLISNLVFFANPIYPLGQSLFTATHPTVPGGAEQVANIMADWRYQPPAAFVERMLIGFKMVFTFSFEPHYSFMNGAPTFGSVFTLCLPLLLVLGKARRIWLGTSVALAGLFFWAITSWVDRNLQILSPLLVAVTAAIVVRSWELGFFAKVGVTALVGVQLAWASALVVSGNDRMNGALTLLRSTLDGRAKALLRSYRSEFVKIGEALPPDAVLMMHHTHVSLGIDRPVFLDMFGFQGEIDYRQFHTVRDVYDRLRALGVTHVAYALARPTSYSLKEEILFSLLVEQCGQKVHNFGSIAVFDLPTLPPRPEPGNKVLVMGISGYTDGLYMLDGLSVSGLLPPGLRHYPIPEKTAPMAQSLIAEAEVVICATSTPLSPNDYASLGRDYRYVTPGGEIRLWVRNR